MFQEKSFRIVNLRPRAPETLETLLERSPPLIDRSVRLQGAHETLGLRHQPCLDGRVPCLSVLKMI